MERASRDVVVIGAGLGGLAAAAYLCKQGLSVLVVERRPAPGGYVTTFERPPFSFEVSLHALDAVGPGEPGHALLDALGVGDALFFRQPEALRREIWPEHDLRLPHGMDGYIRLLGKHFPRDRAGLAELAELAGAAHANTFEVSTRSSLPDALDTSRFLSLLGALGRRTAAEVIDPRVRDPRLRAMLSRFAEGSLGLPIDELSALSWLVSWYERHAFGAYCLEGGSAALCEALSAVIEAHGGEVRLGTPARRIRVQHRRVEGVELSGGRFCAAQAVVSNASPQHTFGELTDPAEVDPRYIHRMERMEPSTSCFKVWLGLRAAPESKVHGPLDHEVLLGASYDRDAGKLFDPCAAPLSVIMPFALGPAGTAAERPWLAISMRMSAESFAAAEAADPSFKARAAEALLSRVEAALFSDLRPLVEVMEVATPITFERFTGNPGGSLYGWSARPDQTGGGRMDAVTPIDGLFLAGAWTQPGGGFMQVLRSGKRAGERIASKIRRRG